MSKKKKNKKPEKAALVKGISSTESTIRSNSDKQDSKQDKNIVSRNIKRVQEKSVTNGRAKTCITVPGFFAGLFLSLILGIYIGTLLPEFTSANKFPNQSSISNDMPKSDAISLSTPSREAVLPPELAKRERELLNSLTTAPDQEKFWIELGDLYFDAHLPNQSINAYSHALAINPANPDVLTDLGVMYRETGNYEKALECFRSAYAINPAHSQSRYNEGIVLANDLHKHDEAKKAWQELLKYKPNAISPNGTPIRKLIEEQN